MFNRIILDLCGGTGSWSEPYKNNGYDVRNITLPESDVRLYTPPENIYGILAAPPCDHFAGSGAQYWKQKDIDGRTLEGLSIVDACMRIIFMTRPVFWCLENPVGRLKRWIGKPKFYYDPCDYAEYCNYYKCPCGAEFSIDLGKYGCPNCMGENVAYYKDRYTKKTCLWGKFNMPEKFRVTPVRVCKQGSWIQKLGGKSKKTKRLRSITPSGFANAFYEANK